MPIKKYLFISFAILIFIFSFLFFQLKTEKYNRVLIEDDENESPQFRAEMAEKRAEYFFRLTRDPSTNSIPQDIREKELSFAKGIPSKEMRLGKSASPTSINWQAVGPNDVGGRTRALRIDVQNSNIIIAGGVSGGIWKSTDGGSSWRLKTQLTEIMSVTSIAQDTRPGYTNTWYYTAGEFNGNTAADWGYTAFFYGGGFYKSTDNGETWVKSQSTSPISWNSRFSFTSKIIVSPVSGSIFVATNVGVIIKSTDGGTSWTDIKGKINSHYYSDIDVNSQGTLVAYLSMAHPTGSQYDDIINNGLFSSTDDGTTWTNITPSNFPTSFQRGVLAFAPSNPNQFYIMATTNQNSITTNREDVYLFKINYSNGTSTNLTSNLPYFASTQKQDYIITQGNYNMAIAVHPTNENLVLLGATSLFRTFDGFTTKPTNSKLCWIGGYNEQSFFYPGLHPDIHTIVFDKNNPNKVWVGHDGGISFTNDITNQNYTTTFPWLSGNNGYNVTQFYTIAIKDFSGDDKIMGGTQDNGTPFFHTSDPAKLSTDVSSGDGAFCSFMSTYAYSSVYEGKIHRYSYNLSGNLIYNGVVSPDTSIAKGQLFIDPFVVDPSDENYMYYLAGDKIWRNNIMTNGNAATVKSSWTSINFGFLASDIISTISVSKTNPSNIVYFAVYNSATQPRIYKMINSKTATTAVDVSPVFPGMSSTQVPTGSYVHSIAINPDNGNEAIAVISNYKVRSLWYTTNGGTSWTDIVGNLRDINGNGPSIRTAAILPLSEGSVFLIGTSTGLYSTSTLNTTNTLWVQEAGSTIGNVVVDFISTRKIDGTIAVGTHGLGAFIGKVDTGVGITEISEIPHEYYLSQNYPNPFNPATKISFTLPKESKVTLKIFNLLGEEVTTLLDGKFSEGKHETNFKGENLASGIYIYKLTADKFTQSKKMLLIK